MKETSPEQHELFPEIAKKSERIKRGRSKEGQRAIKEWIEKHEEPALREQEEFLKEEKKKSIDERSVIVHKKP